MRAHITAFVLAMLVMSALSPGASAIATRQTPDGDLVINHRGDAGLTGDMPGAGPAGTPDIAWEVSSNDGIIMGMAIHNDLLYFASKDPGVLTAVDRATGAVTWEADLGPETTLFGPEVAGDLVVVGMWAPEGNAVVALDGASGQERWRYLTPTLPTAPTHVDGTVYVTAEGGLQNDSAMFALDAATGEERWVFPAPESSDLGEQIAVSDGIAVAASWSLVDNGVGVYAIDVATGQVVWTFTEVDELTMEPIVRNGIVLVTDLPRSWAIDLRTGTVLWEHSGAGTGGGAAVGDGAGYFGYGDEVRAVNLQDGSQLWSAPVSGIAGPPTIANGIVYTAVWKRSDDPSNHWIHAFDAASGTEVWALEIEHRVSGNQPLAHDGVLYVDANDAVVAFASAGAATGTTPQGGTTIPEAPPQGGEYASGEFGHTITWRPPWDLIEPQSSVSAGQDFTTLHAGDASLAIRATTTDASPGEMIEFYVQNLQGSGATPVEVVSDPTVSRATMQLTVDGVALIEYAEVRPLPQGNGLMILILSAPAEWFPLAFQTAQQLVTLDAAPPFQATPAR